MKPTFINTDISDIEKSKMESIIAKRFTNYNFLSFENWPTYTIAHFKTVLGWTSVLLDKKLKIKLISDPRNFMGKIKVRLDIYNDEKFIISHEFTNEADAIKYANYHLQLKKEEGYSNSFLEKLKYSTTNIVKK